MKQAKPGVVFVAAIIALTGIGFGYAHWTETLKLIGTASTGYLDLNWSCTCRDNDDDLKDIADVTCEFSNDKNTLWINVTNAYPGYKVSGTIDIENVGTVPAVLSSVNIVCPDNVIKADTDGDGWPDTLYYDANQNSEPSNQERMATISLTFSGDQLEQIEDTASVEFVVQFTNPGLPEDWEGTFQVTLNFENWSPPQ